MILRRFMKHVTDQNWFAVGLDVIVVIVGIFLGLQVTDWNEDRQNQVRECQYLERFHVEVMEAIDGSTFFLAIYKNYLLELTKVTKILSGEMQADELSPLQCHAIFSAHIFTHQGLSLPTIVELMSAGQLSIIRNEDITRAMSIYNISKESWLSVKSATSNGSYNFSNKYPELIELDKNMNALPLPADETTPLNHVCHLDLMRSNQNFKNNLQDASMRTAGYVDLFLQLQVNQLNNLHDLLEQELGFSHEEGAQ